MPNITNKTDWEALDLYDQERYLDALKALGYMRKGVALSVAAQRVDRTEADVLDFMSGVIDSDGWSWIAEPEDDLFRPMRILTSDGVSDVGVIGSAKASRVGDHWNAVGHFLRTGNTSRLRGFPPDFLVDPDEIIAWWRRGELDFLEIYGQPNRG